jgi:hypothetical protein
MATCWALRDRFVHFIAGTQRVLASVGVVALVSCGGGQNDPAATAAPMDGVELAGAGDAEGPRIALDAPSAVAPSNRIGLTWRAPSSLTSFTVFVRRADGEAFEAIDATVAGASAQFARGAAHRWDFPTARVRVRGCGLADRCVDSNEQPLLDALLGGLVQLSAASFGGVFSGVVLSADGNTLAVNASQTYTNGQGQNVPGAIVVYQRAADGRWTQQAELTQAAPGTALFDSMPFALSGDGNTIVVGNVAEAPDGVVQVFARDAQRHWSRQAYIPAPVPSPFGPFGEKVAISHDGNRVLVGTNSGAIAVLERAAGQWQQAHVIEAGAGALQLNSPLIMAISPDGSSVAAPAIFSDGTQGVHVYKACSCAERWQLVAALRSAARCPSAPTATRWPWARFSTPATPATPARRRTPDRRPRARCTSSGPMRAAPGSVARSSRRGRHRCPTSWAWWCR